MPGFVPNSGTLQRIPAQIGVLLSSIRKQSQQNAPSEGRWDEAAGLPLDVMKKKLANTEAESGLIKTQMEEMKKK